MTAGRETIQDDTGTRAKVNALFECWYAANQMKARFFEQWPHLQSDKDIKPHLADTEAIARNMILWLRYWYSALYVVFEGYTALCQSGLIEQSDIVSTLAEDEQALTDLRRLRNSTFHYQSSWGSEKFNAFFRAFGRAQWIRCLHKELGKISISAESAYCKDAERKTRLAKLLAALETDV